MKSAEASGPTFRNQPAYMVDGDHSTLSAPAKDSNDFSYELDLGEDYNLFNILVFNTTEPTKLSNYLVEVYADNFGTRGTLVWSARIREDNSNSGSEGTDTISAGLDVSGKFNGRYIRFTNYSNVELSLAIAEIEVYEAKLPEINYFESTSGNITTMGNAALPTSAVLSWQVESSSSLSLNNGIGNLTHPTDTLSVSPTNTTAYTLSATNEFGTVTKSITIGIDNAIIDPVISEFMASNLATIADENGDKSDWIELYNPNTFSLNIEGYHLTDDYTNLTKWELPSRSIPPKGYLIVYASKNDQINPEQEIHTNFSLKSDGEYLAIVSKNGTTVLQQFPSDYPNTLLYPNQKEDISYGIGADGTIGFFSPASPLMANTTSDSAIVKEVKFTPNRGIYESSVTASITCSTPNAIIRYTTDGTVPTATNGTIYTGPLVKTATTVIRARGFKEGWVPTKIKTHTYIIIDDVIKAKVMDTDITGNSSNKKKIETSLKEMPSVSLVSSELINPTSETQTSMEWIDPVNAEDLQVNAGIKIYGGSFNAYDKRNFRLYFRGVYGDTKLKHPVFEGFEHTIPTVDKFDNIELRAGGQDMADRGFYISNRLVDDLMLESGTLNPHGRFVHVFIDGIYWGQYHLRERFNTSMFAEHLGGEKEDYESINGNYDFGGWAKLYIPGSGDGLAWENALSLREDYEQVKNYVDVPNLITYMLLYMYGSNEHEFRTVGSIAPGDNGFKFNMSDSDGWTKSGSNRTAMSQPGYKNGDGPGSIFSMLLKEGHPDFMTLLADQIQNVLYNDGVLTPSHITALANERCAEIENSIVAECARWGYRTPDSWTTAKNNYISNVLPTEADVLISEIKGAGFYPDVDAPIFSQHGGLVDAGYELSMFSDEPTVYYTLDGSDPRIPGGNIADNAMIYFASENQDSKLVDETSKVSALVPSSEVLGTTWTSLDYNEDASWINNTTGAGVGFDKNDDYTSHIDLSVMDNMYSKNTSIYLRYSFEIDDISNINSLILKMKCDDGFVAYLNGEVIASLNAPTSLSYNSSATTANNDGLAVQLIEMPITHANALGLLNEGENILAIHGLNTGLTSSDFLIEPELLITKKADEVNAAIIAINDSINVKARAYNNGQWSGITDATFITDPILSSNVTIANTGILLSFYNYPNPFTDHTTLCIAADRSTTAKIEIYNIVGQMIWSESIDLQSGKKNTQRINTSNWEDGMFVYKVEIGSGMVRTGKMLHLR